MDIDETLARRSVAVVPTSLADEPGEMERELLDQLPSSRRLRNLLREIDVLIVNEGFLHLSTTDLTTRLRCSKASLYRLAPGLDDLFELAIRLRMARVADALRAAYEAEPKWPGKLIAWADAFVVEQSKTSFVFMRDLFAFSRGPMLVRNENERRVDEVEAIMQGGIDAGGFSPVNPKLAAHLLSSTLMNICEPGFPSLTGLPIHVALAEALRIFEYGIIRRPGPQGSTTT